MIGKFSIIKVGVGSLGKLVGTVNAIVALAIGVIGSIVSTVGVISNNDYNLFVDILVAIGITLMGIVVYPLIGFVFGWLYGALIAIIWNAVLGVSGGLDITAVERIEESDKKSTK